MGKTSNEDIAKAALEIAEKISPTTDAKTNLAFSVTPEHKVRIDFPVTVDFLEFEPAQLDNFLGAATGFLARAREQQAKAAGGAQ